MLGNEGAHPMAHISFFRNDAEQLVIFPFAQNASTLELGFEGTY